LPITIPPAARSRSTDECVLVRHVALEELRAIGRADALRRRHVLDADRHAEQGRERTTTTERGGRPPRFTERGVAHQRHDRVHRGVHGVDPREDCLHHLERRGPAFSIELLQLDGGREAKIAFRRHGGDSLQ
jgi:hypothetical protein